MTIQELIELVPEGGTLRITDDKQIPDDLVIDRDITIDINGHIITLG